MSNDNNSQDFYFKFFEHSLSKYELMSLYRNDSIDIRLKYKIAGLDLAAKEFVFLADHERKKRKLEFQGLLKKQNLVEILTSENEVKNV